MMGYEKTVETKVLRITHRITFKEGTRAFDLKEMLKSVPDKAIIDEVYDDAQDDTRYIEFLEDKKEE